jgi:nucleotide-binding universal stress UspA family protein
MARVSRILVPVVFSPRCQGAVQYAVALARQFHSEILLLHVISPPTGYFGSFDSASWYTSEEFAQDLEKSRMSDLQAFPCQPEEGSGDVRRLVMHGDPARVIVDTAAAEHADLIVMPTHGYGPFRRFLLGSVTAKVLHDAACPVWTGPHMEEAPVQGAIEFRKILCALDLGPHTREVLCWGAHFAADVGAKLAMVHAIPLTATRLGPCYFDPEWRLMLIGQARERLEFMKQDMGVQGEILVDSGEPSVFVSDTAREWGADLVAIGRGSSKHAHPRLPTHAYAIAREAPCPVVSI